MGGYHVRPQDAHHVHRALFYRARHGGSIPGVSWHIIKGIWSVELLTPRDVQKSEAAYDGKSKTFTPQDHIQLKKNSCGCVYEMGFNGPDVS